MLIFLPFTKYHPTNQYCKAHAWKVTVKRGVVSIGDDPLAAKYEELMPMASFSALSMVASTGDMKNTAEKVLREIRKMKLPLIPDVKGWLMGLPSSLLPIFHAALLHYSLPLAKYLISEGYALYGKNDLNFIHGVFQVMRNEFHYRPRLTEAQFLSGTSYAERKLQITGDFLRLCQEKHKEISLTQHQRRKRKSAVPADIEREARKPSRRVSKSSQYRCKSCCRHAEERGRGGVNVDVFVSSGDLPAVSLERHECSEVSSENLVSSDKDSDSKRNFISSHSSPLFPLQISHINSAPSGHCSSLHLASARHKNRHASSKHHPFEGPLKHHHSHHHPSKQHCSEHYLSKHYPSRHHHHHPSDYKPGSSSHELFQYDSSYSQQEHSYSSYSSQLVSPRPHGRLSPAKCSSCHHQKNSFHLQRVPPFVQHRPPPPPPPPRRSSHSKHASPPHHHRHFPSCSKRKSPRHVSLSPLRCRHSSRSRHASNPLSPIRHSHSSRSRHASYPLQPSRHASPCSSGSSGSKHVHSPSSSHSSYSHPKSNSSPPVSSSPLTSPPCPSKHKPVSPAPSILLEKGGIHDHLQAKAELLASLPPLPEGSDDKDALIQELQAQIQQLQHLMDNMISKSKVEGERKVSKVVSSPPQVPPDKAGPTRSTLPQTGLEGEREASEVVSSPSNTRQVPEKETGPRRSTTGLPSAGPERETEIHRASPALFPERKSIGHAEDILDDEKPTKNVTFSRILSPFSNMPLPGECIHSSPPLRIGASPPPQRALSSPSAIPPPTPSPLWTSQPLIQVRSPPKSSTHSPKQIQVSDASSKSPRGRHSKHALRSVSLGPRNSIGSRLNPRPSDSSRPERTTGQDLNDVARHSVTSHSPRVTLTPSQDVDTPQDARLSSSGPNWTLSQDLDAPESSRQISSKVTTIELGETDGLIRTLQQRAERTRQFLQDATGIAYT